MACEYCPCNSHENEKLDLDDFEFRVKVLTMFPCLIRLHMLCLTACQDLQFIQNFFEHLFIIVDSIVPEYACKIYARISYMLSI